MAGRWGDTGEVVAMCELLTTLRVARVSRGVDDDTCNEEMKFKELLLLTDNL